MLKTQQGLAVTVMIVNLTLTIWAFLKHKPVKGVGTLFTGSCTLASRLNIGVHMLLNVVSTLFLGAGNYCMQILVAPSKQEVAAAHEKRNFLDIGVPSVHKLWSIERLRTFLWVAIGITATLLHLL